MLYTLTGTVGRLENEGVIYVHLVSGSQLRIKSKSLRVSMCACVCVCVCTCMSVCVFVYGYVTSVCMMQEE